MPDALILDLEALPVMHPKLDLATVTAMRRRAAAAFERSGHTSPCGIALTDGDVAHEGTAVWAPADEGVLVMTDARRVTEDAAEGVALAFVGHLASGLCTGGSSRRLRPAGIGSCETRGAWRSCSK